MREEAVFGCDFETDSNHDENTAWIVQWAVSNGKTEWTGRDLNSFGKFIHSHLHTGPHNKKFYFANLSYDGEFFKYILPYLLEKIKDCEPIASYIRPKNRLIGIFIRYKGLNRESRSIAFADILAKLPGYSVELLGQRFGLQKEEGFKFYDGWSEKVDFSLDENWTYVKTDAKIVALACQDAHSRGYVKLTAASDAREEIKRFYAKGKNRYKDANYYKKFPKLSLELDKVLREAYQGGINISPRQRVFEGDIRHFDARSMYPSVMLLDRLPHQGHL